jgi:hypothetical protein
MNGETAITMHHFNYTTGKRPSGKLFLASNGKLYGTATYGGIGSNTATYEQDGNGVLYEYDLTFDTYRVVHYFNYSAPTNIAINPTSGLIEPIPGKLFGGTRWGSFFVYDIATETVTSLNHTYSFEAMGYINSDLITASNGFVYAVSAVSYPCVGVTDPQPNMGAVIKINTTTNTAQKVANFLCVGTQGAGSSGNLAEAVPNKIFFTSGAGIQSVPGEGIISAGTIVEFNTLTNTLTPKITFDVLNSLGYSPRSIVIGDNGNLYGICEQGGDTYRSPFTSGLQHKTGTLFEFNPNSNTIAKLTEFLTFKNMPQTIIKLTTGELMGNLGNGSVFKYNIDANTLQFPDLATYSDFPNQFMTQNLIEICRKPSYPFLETDTFTICVSQPFTFDIQNINAATYIWKKDGIILPAQSTAILHLSSVALTDTGSYTCEMVNECGTTVTMPLQLIADACLGLDEAIGFKDAITLYPNPTNSILNIKLPDNPNFKIHRISIVNTLGQLVYSKSEKFTAIDARFLKTGVYQLVLKTDKGDWNGTFVKE